MFVPINFKMVLASIKSKIKDIFSLNQHFLINGYVSGYGI